MEVFIALQMLFCGFFLHRMKTLQWSQGNSQSRLKIQCTQPEMAEPAKTARLQSFGPHM